MRFAGQTSRYPSSLLIVWSAFFCGLQSCTYNPLIQREQMVLVSEAEMEALGATSWSDHKQITPQSANIAHLIWARQISDRLLVAMGENPADWEIAVFEDSTINAFAMPGRKIGLNSAMVELCLSDDELASVIGHEIAHLELRHASERVSQDLAARGLTGLAGSGDAGAARLFGIGATLGVLLPYSRQHEFEADRLALHYMADAGYDPMAAADLWSRMAAQEDRGRTPVFLSTHPADTERVAAIRREAKRLKEAGP